MEVNTSEPVGVNTTTVDALRESGKINWNLENALNVEVGQKDRFTHVPEYLPFTFGIGGGLSYLKDMQDGQPVWETTPWEGDPPSGYEIGKIYFINSQREQHVKITENPQGGWVWENLDDRTEQLSWKAKEGWEYKLYYPPEHKRSAELNNRLNEKGYTLYFFNDEESLEVPEGLESEKCENNYLRDHTLYMYLVWDPDRADVKLVRTKNSTEEVEAELKQDGFEYIDGNWIRIIYARTKPD